jgi:hypothetical protein
MKTKKKWLMPKLTVLLKQGPQEAVLINCKSGTGGTGAIAYSNNSKYLCDTFIPYLCSICQSIVAS